ncbi:class I SAM-dependent methyltransferase [Rhodobacter sp. Har01]|uniref:class I SAM-dependent methyltransferase n=1 Tax=Rhodobacter sp. Har01 TaxID=2883999 RepID=UPI001D090488|nr:methyltransferase domain-containing protein [Rhodobacter sp. Har01]MCB6177854.1 class I SAM-dependent methyltransferase [Rhodobacter sp. Har01]
MTLATDISTAAASPVAQPRVLHVGCGAAHPDKLPEAFFPRGVWAEVRLDIDPGVAPDIVASITDMAVVPTASVDAVWSAHNLEHLWAHEVRLALAEFLRVLRPGGFALVTMPDLQQVAALVAEGNLEGPAYMSALGPIAAIDMLYGFRPALAEGNAFMGHRCGFTAVSLTAHLQAAGFADVRVQRDGGYALWATAVKPA